jgi:hypothetical protein
VISVLKDQLSILAMCGDTVANLRERFKSEQGCEFVHSADFCKLLVSSLDLKRSDEKAARLAGLRDMSTGIRYFIELEKLGIYRW